MNNDNAILFRDYIFLEIFNDDVPVSVVGELFLKLFSSSNEIRIISDLFDLEVVAVMKSPYAKHSRFFKKHSNPRFDTIVVSQAIARIGNPCLGATLSNIDDNRFVLDMPIFLGSQCIGYVMCGLFYSSVNFAENSKSAVLNTHQIAAISKNIAKYGSSILQSCFKFTRQETFNNYYDYKMLFNYGSFYDYNLMGDTFVLSKQCAGIFGWNLRDHYTYNDFVQSVVPADRQRVTLFMRNQIFLGDSNYLLETTIQRPNDGKLVDIQISGTIIKDNEGYNVRTLGTIYDVSLLKETQERLKEENEAKNRLLRIIGHDLKNPFNGLIGFSDLLISDIQHGNYDEAVEFASIIKQSAIEGYDLLVNLLDYSTSQAQNLTANYSEFDLFAIVDSISRLSSAQACRKGISLENHVQPGTIIYSDENKVNTVLRNLISNAIKFCYKDGTVVVEAVCETENAIRISVSDTGVDIPDEKLALINKSRSVESTRGTAQEKGTSIGLKMCHTFLNLLGTKLVASSGDGLTTFYFYMPARRG